MSSQTRSTSRVGMLAGHVPRGRGPLDPEMARRSALGGPRCRAPRAPIPAGGLLLRPRRSQPGGPAMTRVLVVHHDIDMADLETDELRSRGYEVEQCWGPKYTSCPVMRGEKCAAADRADG